MNFGCLRTNCKSSNTSLHFCAVLTSYLYRPNYLITLILVGVIGFPQTFAWLESWYLVGFFDGNGYVDCGGGLEINYVLRLEYDYELLQQKDKQHCGPLEILKFPDDNGSRWVPQFGIDENTKLGDNAATGNVRLVQIAVEGQLFYRVELCETGELFVTGSLADCVAEPRYESCCMFGLVYSAWHLSFEWTRASPFTSAKELELSYQIAANKWFDQKAKTLTAEVEPTVRRVTLLSVAYWLVVGWFVVSTYRTVFITSERTTKWVEYDTRKPHPYECHGCDFRLGTQ